jgi:hypothetical protein
MAFRDTQVDSLRYARRDCYSASPDFKEQTTNPAANFQPTVFQTLINRMDAVAKKRKKLQKTGEGVFAFPGEFRVSSLAPLPLVEPLGIGWHSLILKCLRWWNSPVSAFYIRPFSFPFRTSPFCGLDKFWRRFIQHCPHEQ